MNQGQSVQLFTNIVHEFTSHTDFSPSGNVAFKQKQKQLIQFSKNRHSLVVCLNVLQSNNSEGAAIYFASQFVKDKLKYEFEQLCKEDVEATYLKIVGVIKNKQQYSKVVSKNLSLCLTYIYIHCSKDLGSVLNFFNNAFLLIAPTGQHDLLYYQYLFKYLDGIACEIDNRRLVIDQVVRNQVDKSLKAQQPQILRYLNQIQHQIRNRPEIKLSPDDVEHFLFSFSEWLKLTDPPMQITFQLHEHGVLRLAMTSLSDSLISEASMEALLSAIQIMKKVPENVEFYKFMDNNLMEMVKKVDVLINQMQHIEAENMLRVICDYGSHVGKKIIDYFDEGCSYFLTKMIQFTNDENLQVFQSFVDFWQSIIYFITSRSAQSPLTPHLADQLVGKVYATFCERIKYSTGQIADLDSMSQRQLGKMTRIVQDIKDRRDNARYIFQCVANYFGNQNFLIQVMKHISQQNTNQQNSWPQIQAAIFSLRDAAKSFPEPSPPVCELVMLLQRINPKHVIVIKSILRVYDSLLQMQVKNEEFILIILTQIVSIFQIKLLRQKVDVVFERCCQSNAVVLIKYIDKLFQILQRYPENNSILQGITFVLKSYPQLLCKHLPIMLKGPMESLRTIKSKKQKRAVFNRLFTIIQSVPKGQTNNLGEIIEALFIQMWPIISQMFSEPDEGDQDKLVERAVKFLKLTMRSIPQKFINHLPTIFTKTLQYYNLYPINSFVYLFEATFTTYYQNNNPQLIEYLKNLYMKYCQITYSHFSNSNSINQLQHLADDFIGLNKRIITYHTRMFVQCEQVQKILQFSVNCLGSGVLRPASSASQLFQIVFMIYWTPHARQQYQLKDKGEVLQYKQNNVDLYNILEPLIKMLVPNLIARLFQVLESVPTESVRDNVLDCLEAIALAFPSQSQKLWAQPLIGLSQDILTRSQKQSLLDNLLKIGSNDMKVSQNGEDRVSTLVYTISDRFRNRQSRVDSFRTQK